MSSVIQYRGQQVKLSLKGSVSDSTTGNTTAQINLYDTDNNKINAMFGSSDRLIIMSAIVTDDGTGGAWGSTLLVLNVAGNTGQTAGAVNANILLAFDMAYYSPSAWRASGEGLTCAKGIIPSIIYTTANHATGQVMFIGEAIWIPGTTGTPSQYTAAQLGG